jgi:hypothetical protein
MLRLEADLRASKLSANTRFVALNPQSIPAIEAKETSSHGPRNREPWPSETKDQDPELA